MLLVYVCKKKKKSQDFEGTTQRRIFSKSDKNVRSIFQKCSTIHNFQLVLTPL